MTPSLDKNYREIPHLKGLFGIRIYLAQKLLKFEIARILWQFPRTLKLLKGETWKT
jgi:hypothetical protein